MSANSFLKEVPVVWHTITSQVSSGSPTGSYNKYVQDASSSAGYRPCTAVRPRKGLPLVAALATVSAVIFLAYLCSLSIRGRISTQIFGRKLAGGADGEESNETDPCITHTDTHTSPDTPQQHIGNLIPSSSRHIPSTTWHAGLGIQGQTLPLPEKVAAVPILGLSGQQRRAKRKEREGTSEEKAPKLFRHEALNQEALPEPPSLDPDVELLIDSVLSENENILHEDVWITDDDIEHSKSATHSEDAAPMEDSVGQLSQPVAMETNHIAPLLSGALLPPAGAELTGTTPLSLFESVLSESSHASQAVSLDDWLLSGEAADLLDALQPMPSPEVFPPMPSSIAAAKEATKSHAGLSGTMSEGTMHSEPLSSSGPLQNDYPRERSGEEWLRIPIGGLSMPTEQGLASSTLGSSTLRNLLSSTTSTSSTTTVLRDADEGSIQSLSKRAQLAIHDLFSSRGWIEELLRDVPDQVLETHPFYRFPMKQLILATFSMANAERFAANFHNVVVVLSECRRILKKTSLSHEDTKALLGYTESLYGYATGTMPGENGGFATIQTIEALGRVLFVMDTLHCAAEVLGEASKKYLWWPRIVERIESARYLGRLNDKRPRKSNWIDPTLKALDVALDYYRIGDRPPVRLLVGLKLALVEQPHSTKFNNPKWDPWRTDAQEWLESIQPSSQTSGQST